MVPINQPIEYKYCIVSGNSVKSWIDAESRHVTPTGPEMTVEDDDGLGRAHDNLLKKSGTISIPIDQPFSADGSPDFDLQEGKTLNFKCSKTNDKTSNQTYHTTTLFCSICNFF